MATTTTPFEILGLAHDNYTAKAAKEAYHRLVKKFHPDTNPDRADAEERMKEVNWAYSILGGEEAYATWKEEKHREKLAEEADAAWKREEERIAKAVADLNIKFAAERAELEAIQKAELDKFDKEEILRKARIFDEEESLTTQGITIREIIIREIDKLLELPEEELGKRVIWTAIFIIVCVARVILF